jgi:hypothetical protein
MAGEEFMATLDKVCAELGWERTEDAVVVPLEQGRHQRILLELFDFEEQALVRAYTYIGPVERIDPLRLNTALHLNFGLPHGALALKNDRLTMVDTLLAEEPDREEIQVSLLYLAELSDQLEASLFGTDEF